MEEQLFLEVMEAVGTLNAEIYEQIGDLSEEINLGLRSNGDIVIILFCDIQIWNSDEDERREISEDVYEPIEEYLRRWVNRYIKGIKKVKL